MRPIAAVLIVILLSLSIMPSALAISTGSSSHSNSHYVESASTPYPSIFTADVGYKSVMLVKSTSQVYVNATSGFKNYNLTVYFAGENMTGFQPTNTFHKYQSDSPYFVFNITAPTTPQTVYFSLNMSATNATGRLYHVASYEISVLSPIVLFATVTNKNPAPIYNVTLAFELDGIQRATKVIPVVHPYSTVKVSVSIVPLPPLKKGEHTITVSIVGNNPLILINGQQANSYTSTFYYGSPPNYSWIYYIAIPVVIFMLFMIYVSGRRPPAGSQVPKWRK